MPSTASPSLACVRVTATASPAFDAPTVALAESLRRRRTRPASPAASERSAEINSVVVASARRGRTSTPRNSNRKEDAGWETPPGSPSVAVTLT